MLDIKKYTLYNFKGEKILEEISHQNQSIKEKNWGKE